MSNSMRPMSESLASSPFATLGTAGNDINTAIPTVISPTAKYSYMPTQTHHKRARRLCMRSSGPSNNTAYTAYTAYTQQEQRDQTGTNTDDKTQTPGKQKTRRVYDLPRTTMRISITGISLQLFPST